MRQIRVAWTPGSHSAREPGVFPREGGEWLLDTPQHRADIQSLIMSGNEVCGAATHWLEQRDATLASFVMGGVVEEAAKRGSRSDRPHGPPSQRTVS